MIGRGLFWKFLWVVFDVGFLGVFYEGEWGGLDGVGDVLLLVLIIGDRLGSLIG